MIWPHSIKFHANSNFSIFMLKYFKVGNGSAVTSDTGEIQGSSPVIGNIFTLFLFYKKCAITGLFFVYFRFNKQTIQFLQQIHVKMSIQYTVLRFKPTTFLT